LVRECGHAFAEGAGEAWLPVKFEEADGLGDGAVEARWRIDAGVCGRLVLAAGVAGEVSRLAESYAALVGLTALDAKGTFDAGAELPTCGAEESVFFGEQSDAALKAKLRQEDVLECLYTRVWYAMVFCGMGLCL
jgi:hypothetical protein